MFFYINLIMISKKGLIYALTSSATFGLITLFTVPVINSGTLDSTSILFYRLLFATIGIGLACLVNRNSFALKWNEIPKLLILGIFYAATALFLLLSYSLIPSGISTTIHFLYPVAVTLLMILFFKERISLKVIASAMIAITGVALVSMRSDEGMGASSTLGITYVLISVLSYGVYIVGVNKIGIERINSMALTFYVLLSGTILVGTYAFSHTGIMPITEIGIGINLILLAVICTVISNLTLILAVKNIGSTVTSILGSLEPLISVAVGILVFSESITMIGYFGIFLIIASVIMIVKS